MDKKMLTIILAVVMIACFFLDWGGHASAFDLVKAGGGSVLWERYVLLLIPVSGALLLVGAVNNGNYPLGRNTLCWLPLLTVLFWIFGMPLIEGAAFGDLFKGLGKGWGIGMWIAVVGSLVLALYNPKN